MWHCDNTRLTQHAVNFISVNDTYHRDSTFTVVRAMSQVSGGGSFSVASELLNRFSWNLARVIICSPSDPTCKIRWPLRKGIRCRDRGGVGGGWSPTLTCLFIFFWFPERTHSWPRQAWTFVLCTQECVLAVDLGSICPRVKSSPFVTGRLSQTYKRDLCYFLCLIFRPYTTF